MKITLKNKGTINKNVVVIDKGGGDYTALYFSYETIVAIAGRQNGESFFHCRQNDWSTTTGKFLNEIQPDKSKRITGQEFETLLAKYL